MYNKTMRSLRRATGVHNIAPPAANVESDFISSAANMSMRDVVEERRPLTLETARASNELVVAKRENNGPMITLLGHRIHTYTHRCALLKQRRLQLLNDAEFISFKQAVREISERLSGKTTSTAFANGNIRFATKWLAHDPPPYQTRGTRDERGSRVDAPASTSASRAEGRRAVISCLALPPIADKPFDQRRPGTLLRVDQRQGLRAEGDVDLDGLLFVGFQGAAGIEAHDLPLLDTPDPRPVDRFVRVHDRQVNATTICAQDLAIRGGVGHADNLDHGIGPAISAFGFGVSERQPSARHDHEFDTVHGDDPFVLSGNDFAALQIITITKFVTDLGSLIVRASHGDFLGDGETLHNVDKADIIVARAGEIVDKIHKKISLLSSNGREELAGVAAKHAALADDLACVVERLSDLDPLGCIARGIGVQDSGETINLVGWDHLGFDDQLDERGANLSCEGDLFFSSGGDHVVVSLCETISIPTVTKRQVVFVGIENNPVTSDHAISQERHQADERPGWFAVAGLDHLDLPRGHTGPGSEASLRVTGAKADGSELIGGDCGVAHGSNLHTVRVGTVEHPENHGHVGIFFRLRGIPEGRHLGPKLIKGGKDSHIAGGHVVICHLNRGVREAKVNFGSSARGSVLTLGSHQSVISGGGCHFVSPWLRAA